MVVVCRHRRVFDETRPGEAKVVRGDMARSVELPASYDHEPTLSGPHTFSSTGADSHLVTRLEDPSTLGDGMMHLCLEHFKEAGFAHLLPRLGSTDEGFVGPAELAESGRHIGRSRVSVGVAILERG